MSFGFKGYGKSFAVTRLCGILLSLSFFAICLCAVFSLERVSAFLAREEYETKLAAEMEGDVKQAFSDVAELLKKEQDLKPSKSKNSAPSPLHLGVGKAFKVTVVADGEEQTFSVNSGTVSDILKKAGLKKNDTDLLNYELTDALQPGMTVKLRRVTYQIEKETVTLDYKTKKKKTNELYLGDMYISRDGENGTREDTYICTYIDGVFKKRTLAVSETIKKPVTQIIMTGTKKRVVKLDDVGTLGYSGLRAVSELPSKVKIELDEYGKPVKYKQKIVGSATAYYGGGITATGQRAMPGRVAVDPREIPYGSKLYIVSCDGSCIYGYCEASDTGGFIYNSNTVVDLYFNTYSECVNFGRRNVEIYVLE